MIADLHLKDYYNPFYREFLKGFMDILRRQYGTRRIHCNVVYQEYSKDKDHYHMNATRVSRSANSYIHTTHPSTYPSICLFIHLSLSIHLSIHPFIYPSVCTSIHQFLYLSLYPSIYLYINLSIQWSTLTGFVMWLGRNGLCEVESTPKGWYITYIDRSPEALARQAVS